MRARSATVGDLEAIFHDLSKRLADEYVAAGKDSKAAYDNLMMDLKEGRAHALVKNDTAVAIIAWHERGGAADTLFSARDDFFTRTCLKAIPWSSISIRPRTRRVPLRLLRHARCPLSRTGSTSPLRRARNATNTRRGIDRHLIARPAVLL